MNLLRKCSNWKFIPYFLVALLRKCTYSPKCYFPDHKWFTVFPSFFFFFSDWFISRRLYLKLFVARDTEVIQLWMRSRSILAHALQQLNLWPLPQPHYIPHQRSLLLMVSVSVNLNVDLLRKKKYINHVVAAQSHRSKYSIEECPLITSGSDKEMILRTD